MPENAQVDRQQDKETDIDKGINGNNSLLEVSPVGLPIRLRGILLGGGVLLVVLLLISIFLPNLTERMKFFTVNALSLLVLLVIAVQTYIYRRQWEVIERQEKVMREGLEETRNLLRQNEWAFKENHRHANATRAQLQEQSEAMKGQLDAMKEQSAIMEMSLVIGTRAYVGVHSINLRREEPETLSVKIENIGHVPAENIELVMELIAILPDWWAKQHPTLKDFRSHMIQETFGRTKLFKGNLQIMAVVTLADHLF